MERKGENRLVVLNARVHPKVLDAIDVAAKAENMDRSSWVREFLSCHFGIKLEA